MPKRLRSLRLLIVFFFGFVGFSNAARAGTACVWRVTNVPVPFYLVGTIHALRGTDYPLPKAYNQALRDSAKLLFEVDPRPKNDWSEAFNKAAKYPKGDRMQNHVHAKTWMFLVKNWKGTPHYDLAWLEEHRPWAVALIVWGIRGNNDLFNAHGADKHLAYQARRLGKEVGGLESNKEHMAFLRGMSDVDAENLLLDAVIRGDKGDGGDFNMIREAWKRGDTGAIWAENMRLRKESPRASIRLLDERNIRWIPRIKAEMKTGKPTSIVAGTLHFCGPNSVVQLLQRQGYKVEQL